MYTAFQRNTPLHESLRIIASASRDYAIAQHEQVIELRKGNSNFEKFNSNVEKIVSNAETATKFLVSGGKSTPVLSNIYSMPAIRVLTQCLVLVTNQEFKLDQYNKTLKELCANQLYQDAKSSLKDDPKLQSRFEAVCCNYNPRQNIEEQRCQSVAEILDLCFDIIEYCAEQPAPAEAPQAAESEKSKQSQQPK